MRWDRYLEAQNFVGKNHRFLVVILFLGTIVTVTRSLGTEAGKDHSSRHSMGEAYVWQLISKYQMMTMTYL